MGCGASTCAGPPYVEALQPGPHLARAGAPDGNPKAVSGGGGPQTRRCLRPQEPHCAVPSLRRHWHETHGGMLAALVACPSGRGNPEGLGGGGRLQHGSSRGQTPTSTPTHPLTAPALTPLPLSCPTHAHPTPAPTQPQPTPILPTYPPTHPRLHPTPNLHGCNIQPGT